MAHSRRSEVNTIEVLTTCSPFLAESDVWVHINCFNPMPSLRVTRTPVRRRNIRRGPPLFRRLGHWYDHARLVGRKLRAVPATIRIIAVAALALAAFFAANFVYQVVRKPTEIFVPGERCVQ